jgi:hypothetical protein
MKLKRKLTIPMVQLTCAIGLFSGVLLVQHTAAAGTCKGSCTVQNGSSPYTGSCVAHTDPVTQTVSCLCNYKGLSQSNWYATTPSCSKLAT